MAILCRDVQRGRTAGLELTRSYLAVQQQLHHGEVVFLRREKQRGCAITSGLVYSGLASQQPHYREEALL